jgi:hypothetical protein
MHIEMVSCNPIGWDKYFADMEPVINIEEISTQKNLCCLFQTPTIYEIEEAREQNIPICEMFTRAYTKDYSCILRRKDGFSWVARLHSPTKFFGTQIFLASRYGTDIRLVDFDIERSWVNNLGEYHSLIIKKAERKTNLYFNVQYGNDTYTLYLKAGRYKGFIE